MAEVLDPRQETAEDAEELEAPTGVGDAVDIDAQESASEEEPAEASAEGEEEATEEEPDPRAELRKRARWYVIHSYSGMENKVKRNLEHRAESMRDQGGDKIFQVIVPTEEHIELKDGQRRIVERRVFPGYILVEMVMDEDSWYVVRNTPGVTGFVGVGNKPTPLEPEEVERIMKRIEEEEPKIDVSVRPGDRVRITEGPFADFHGIVDEVYPEKGKARVLVSFFNRETPVEVDFLQLEKQ
ncbi:MAG TPA: transcription termination/antitermination factor NusG [Caldilineae bacterium]|nr:transcription termination/antitermination factor NusG [Caldilineae bacterium]